MNQNNNNGNNLNPTFVVKVDRNELVDSLRNIIYSKCQIAPNRQILFFNNKQLLSGSRLNEYHGLNGHSTINVLYNDNKDWFNKERQNIEECILKLNESINHLKNEQNKIDSVTKNLRKCIETAPNLSSLNECKIDDFCDQNMSKLNAMVHNFQSNKAIKDRIDSCLHSLNLLIANALTSVNHEEEIKCSQIDEKMQKIETEMKRMEQTLNELESERARICSKNDKHRSDLNQITEHHIASNEHKIEAIVNGINMQQIVDNLRQSQTKRFRELESKNDEFDSNELIVWIKHINNGHFAKESGEFDWFFECIERECIDGSHLQELSSNVCLSLLGLTNECDQNILIQHVNNLLRMNMNNDFIVKGNRCCACLSKCIQCVLVPCGHQPYCYEWYVSLCVVWRLFVVCVFDLQCGEVEATR